MFLEQVSMWLKKHILVGKPNLNHPDVKKGMGWLLRYTSYQSQQFSHKGFRHIQSVQLNWCIDPKMSRPSFCSHLTPIFTRVNFFGCKNGDTWSSVLPTTLICGKFSQPIPSYIDKFDKSPPVCVILVHVNYPSQINGATCRAKTSALRFDCLVFYVSNHGAALSGLTQNLEMFLLFEDFFSGKNMCYMLSLFHVKLTETTILSHSSISVFYLLDKKSRRKRDWMMGQYFFCRYRIEVSIFNNAEGMTRDVCAAAFYWTLEMFHHRPKKGNEQQWLFLPCGRQ